MSAGAPWSVKGIDPKAREVAKDLARRSGMTLGEWLNRIILEDDMPEEVSSEGVLRARASRPLLDMSDRRPSWSPPPLSGDIGLVLAEQTRLSERLMRLETQAEATGPRSPEALKVLERAQALDPEALVETVLRRLDERLAGSEARTAAVIGDLKGALSAMDSRLAMVERVGPGGGALEAQLADVAEQVRAVERRSAQAVERMGREVINMADALNRRLGAAEERNAEAIDQVGGEIARIAGAVEARLARAEHAQAEALDRLGAELIRVTDRFTERLAGSERRAVEAIDHVGEQVARITERIEQRYDRATTDFADRIRESEARSHALLHAAAARPLPAAPEPAEPEPEDALELSVAAPTEAPSAAAAEPTPEEVLFARFAPEPPPPADGDEAHAFTDALGLGEGFAPIPEADDDIFEVHAVEEPAPQAERPLSTREVIERARAAARAAQEVGARPVEVRARVDRRAAGGRLFNGFGASARAPARRTNSAVQTAIMVAGGAAFLSVGAAGVVLMEGPDGVGRLNAPVAEAPRAAVALASNVSRDGLVQPPADTAAAEAVKQVEAGEPGALANLKALAQGGSGQAQFYLAQLYEGGEAGVVRNMAEARRWTALAAEAGVPKAMHNLGVYFFRGDGGPQDLASAAQWFRKAATAGLVESQYNLALMYQSGSGVKKDLVEARRWFLHAAARGDEQARAAAEALTARPAGATPAAQAAMDVAAAKQILSRLGYYDGPVDPLATPEFKTALSDYQRDQGQPATGALDAQTAALLSVFQR